MKLILFNKRKQREKEIKQLKEIVFNLGEQIDNLKNEIQFDKDLKRQKNFKKLIGKDVIITISSGYFFGHLTTKFKKCTLLGVKLSTEGFEFIVEEKNGLNVYNYKTKEIFSVIENKIQSKK